MHRQIAGSLTGPVTKWIVLVVVLLASVGLGVLGFQLGDVKSNEAASWLPDSAESTKVAEQLSGSLDPDDIPTLVVYHRAGGLTEEDLAAIDAQALEIAAEVDGVVVPPEGSPEPAVLTPNGAEAARAAIEAQGGDPSVVPPMLSRDRTVAYAFVTLNFGSAGWAEVPASADQIRDIADMDGVDVELGGAGGMASDFAGSFEGSHMSMIMITFAVVILILLFTYRSPVLWFLPILCAVASFLAAQGAVYLAAKHLGVTVNDQSQYILGILVIGAGTDYALLLVARYREELRNFEDRHEAMAHALHRAAPAIIASAATVALGLMCLVVADLNSTAGLGPVLAISVGITLFIMVTLFPALLVICGRWIFWPKRPAFGSAEPTTEGLWARVGEKVSLRPRAVWVTTTVLLAIACLGLFRLDTGGLTTEESFTSELGSIKALDLLTEHGLSDTSNTVQVVADDADLPAVRAALAEVPGLGTGADGAVALTEAQSLSGGRSWFEASLENDVSSEAAFETVEKARSEVHAAADDALVGGQAAVWLDSSEAADRDNRVIIPMVLAVVFLILVLLLRSLVAPLLLMATVVLSFGAALGLSALLFEYVLGFAGADPGFPLFAFVFLVALGIDYNIFLMTRVREETLTRGTHPGSLIALASTGGVITSAGLVLAATFGVLATLPMVFLIELGVAVALGVILDTMIVRSVLVTALNLDLGDRIWWPSKLAAGKTDPDDAPELVNA